MIHRAHWTRLPVRSARARTQPVLACAAFIDVKSLCSSDHASTRVHDVTCAWEMRGRRVRGSVIHRALAYEER
jgi:hypothetical protein